MPALLPPKSGHDQNPDSDGEKDPKSGRGKKQKELKPKYSGDPDEFRLTLVEHLDELRSRLIKSIAAIGIGWAGGWIWWQPIYGYLANIIDHAVRRALPPGTPYSEMITNATDAFLLQLHFSFLVGLIIAFPVLVVQIWGFVAPALKPNEQKPFRKLAPTSAFLFLLGVGFAWAVTPSAVSWFASYLVNFPHVELHQQAGTMVFFVMKLLLAFGIAFQLPLIVYGLGLAGLLSAETLLKYWRQTSIVIFVVASIVTPSNDPITMLAMAIPLVILFVISVYAVKWVQRDKTDDLD